MRDSRKSLEELLQFATFPQRLAAAMALRGINARQLSRKVKSISHTSIHNYLNGTQEPKVSSVVLLADGLKIFPETLMQIASVEEVSDEDNEWMNASLGKVPE